MQTWSITLHGPAGVVSTVETGEAQFIVGTETARDVFTVHGEGVAERHAWVWIGEVGLHVEDLGGGTLVNGHQITERVQVEYPASVQVGEVTLVIELKQAVAAEESVDVTIPQKAPVKSTSSTDVTIPQRKPTKAGLGTVDLQPTSNSTRETPDAPLTGGYTLVREIARGGMGQIYFGEDPQLKRQVAVKVSSLAYGGEDPRFTKEAEVLAHLAHPNIVPIHAMGVDAQGRPFYSMKLVKGRTLQAVLNQVREGDEAAVKEFSRSTLLTIFRKVCDAMAFAHAKGVLHRDLKPENIMVGEYGEVLVMDWGLAKVLGGNDDVGTGKSPAKDTGNYGMTLEGEVMGTPQYMSPEQAEGMVAELDARSDVYALGGILYAILTLRPPIEGTTLHEVLTKVKKGEISSMVIKRGGKGVSTSGAPTALGFDVPEALQAVTLKAMATERYERYESVEAFASDIEAYQNGFATDAEHAGTMKRLILFIKRNKTVSSAVALFLLATLTFTVRLELEKDRALSEMEKSRRAAAQAQMSLAETAEEASDSAALQRALLKVPDDLRTGDWRYLRSRIDTATFTIKAPPGQYWAALEDWPSEPEEMIALRTDGELFSVNVRSGTLQSLWRFNPPDGAGRMGPIAVSTDGLLVAVRYQPSGKAPMISVNSLKTGEWIAGFSDTSAWYPDDMILSDDICVMRGGASSLAGAKIQVWNYRSGKKLWELNRGLLAALSADTKSLLVVNASAQVQRLGLLSGEVQSTGVHPVGVHGWYVKNFMGTADWTTLFSPQSGVARLRSLDPWNGKVHFEITPRYGNFSSALIVPGDTFVTLGKTGVDAGVLEWRDTTSGDLLRSLPFRQRADRLEAYKIVSKAHTAAIGFPASIQIWRLEKSTPGLDFRNLPAGGSKRLEATNRWIESEKSAVCLVERSIEHSKRVEISKAAFDVPVGWLSFGGFASDRSGQRWVCYGNGKAGAFRLTDSVIEPIWGLKSIGHHGFHAVAMSLDGDRIWTGGSVLDFSTGSEASRVSDRRGLNGVNCAVWVGADRVAEIAYVNPTSEASTRKDVPEEAPLAMLRLALWNANKGELLTAVDASKAEWICASPDGRQIAEAGSDKRVRIRNGHTLEVEREFRAHEDGVTGLAWHPSLPLLVTSAKDGMLRVWNINDLSMVEEWFFWAPRGHLRRESYWEHRIEITPNGQELNVYRGNRAVVYRPRSFEAAK